MIDQVQWLLGNTVRGSTTAYSQIQWPKIRVIDQTKNEVIGEIDSDVPDLFFITGAPQDLDVSIRPMLTAQARSPSLP